MRGPSSVPGNAHYGGVMRTSFKPSSERWSEKPSTRHGQKHLLPRKVPWCVLEISELVPSCPSQTSHGCPISLIEPCVKIEGPPKGCCLPCCFPFNQYQPQGCLRRKSHQVATATEPLSLAGEEHKNPFDFGFTHLVRTRVTGFPLEQLQFIAGFH